eukprot:1960599-Rhodomonas_salina.2
MRPQSKALCMRSRVTISRMVFHQISGPSLLVNPASAHRARHRQSQPIAQLELHASRSRPMDRGKHIALDDFAVGIIRNASTHRRSLRSSPSCRRSSDQTDHDAHALGSERRDAE